MTPTAKMDAIVEAVKAGSLTQEEALKQLGDLMKRHPKSVDYASGAVSEVLGIPSEPKEPTEVERERAREYFVPTEIKW